MDIHEEEEVNEDDMEEEEHTQYSPLLKVSLAQKSAPRRALVAIFRLLSPFSASLFLSLFSLFFLSFLHFFSSFSSLFLSFFVTFSLSFFSLCN